MLHACIRKQFGSGNGSAFTINIEIRAANGVTVLFGSSGAGKTSILRAIAGILKPDSGRISLGEKVYFDSEAGINLPMQERKVGYVFQNHALFPHLTAEQNILYGARSSRGYSARERAQELLSLLGIEKAADRRPKELSGGEQQRVALARALATDPCIMLLDEPLSALDMATRSRLVEEISAIQRQSGIPFLYVTHNQSEAVRLGEAMIVIDEGQIVQEGTPLEIFNAPRTASVARVVGAENIFVGKILRHHPEDGTTTIDVDSCLIEVPLNGLPPGCQATIGIRSEDIIVSRERLTQISARNVLQGVIRHIFIDIDKTELVVHCGIDFKVSITQAAVRELKLEVGTTAYLLIKARAVHLLE
ncbi:MAG TPA: molybdenum ABC transporter ATP-binding protein [Acidobacteriota bacterium]|nr:molybdenum ABC transporter ATP-binding protein [Acidobacteriota bacterium]